MAQREADCAIITHTENSRHGDIQQAIFAENGADLSRILIGHQDEQTDWTAIRDLAERGTFVGIDRVGYDILAPDERRADHVAALVQAGYERQVCLSQDCICTMASPRLPFAVPPEYNLTPAIFLAGNKPLSYVVTAFSAMLRERGVSEETLDTIFRRNPRRLLTGAE
jgi:phosphotriesterase-related protein